MENNNDWMLREAPQTEWIRGQGLFICIAFFLGGVSGGLYLASLFFNSLFGMFIAWLLSLVMCGFYMLHLGQRSPLRVWRMMLKPQTSWISRGLIFISLFIGLGFIQLCLSFWAPGPAELVFKVLAGIMAFAQSIYTGFVLSFARSIKFWNSALIPVLFVCCGFLGGLAILLAVNLGGGQSQIFAIENVIRVSLIAYAVMIAVYLLAATYIDPVAKDAVADLVHGGHTLVFWGGVVFCGIVVPIAVSITSYFASEVASALLITTIVFEIIGGFSLRYAILSEGYYTPILRELS
jgi:formate-dependent nitrite reductase membrane component NrfD